MGEMLMPSCRARSSSRNGVPGVSSPMMIDSRRRSSAASAIVRWRTLVPAGTSIGVSTEADPEAHLIRCQTRERIGSVARRASPRACHFRTDGAETNDWLRHVPRERGVVMEGFTRARLVALVLAAAAALVIAATAAARTHASPIVIGWAFDSKGAMAPFDGPALAAAQVRVKQIDAK